MSSLEPEPKPAVDETSAAAPELALDWEGWHDRGVELGNAGDHDGAEHAFRKATLLAPENPVPHASLAQALSLENQHEEALEHLERAWNLGGAAFIGPERFANYIYNVGMLHYNAHDYAAASASYERALGLVPDDWEIRARVAVALVLSGQGEAGLRRARQAVLARPDKAETHLNLGLVFSKLGRDSEAAKAYRASLEWDEASPTGWMNLGASLGKLKDYEAAEAALLKALELADEDRLRVETLSNLSVVYKESGRDDQAVEVYRNLLAIEPSRGLSWSGLGQCLANLGRDEEAIAAYRRAVALDSGAGALNNLAGLVAAEGKLDEAEEFAARAVSLRGTTWRPLATYGTILAIQGRASGDRRTLDRAANELSRALDVAQALGEEDKNELAVTNLDLGNALALADRHGPAAAAYQRAIELGTAGSRPVMAAIENLESIGFRASVSIPPPSIRRQGLAAAAALPLLLYGVVGLERRMYDVKGFLGISALAIAVYVVLAYGEAVSKIKLFGQVEINKEVLPAPEPLNVRFTTYQARSSTARPAQEPPAADVDA